MTSVDVDVPARDRQRSVERRKKEGSSWNWKLGIWTSTQPNRRSHSLRWNAIEISIAPATPVELRRNWYICFKGTWSFGPQINGSRTPSDEEP